MVSGEPLPVEKGVGAEVIGGTINTTGALTIRAERVGRDTMLSQIVALVVDRDYQGEVDRPFGAAHFSPPPAGPGGACG